ncbi:MAG: hypothetical protein ACK50P_23725 [Planctomycetaceae bacterium]
MDTPALRWLTALLLLSMSAAGGIGWTGQTHVSQASQDRPGAGHNSPESPPGKHPLFLSPHFNPLVTLGGRLYVVNTPADTVDVIDCTTLDVVDRIPVGVEPVCVVPRPDGTELWVSNHVSDSVSVIDLRADSPTWHQVVATIQEFDPETRATRFDEPVGIAFASDRKAYVALSSENAIAVVDVPTRQVTGRLSIPAQDPRAIVVRNGRLYVLPFESNNQTQLSGGTGKLDGELATFDAVQHSIANNNVLSLGAVVDIVKHPRVPDRDLFVFETGTDTLVQTHEHLGTLLYGLVVDSHDTVYIAQTDARNHVNGRAGTARHGLAELGNRPFLNQVTCVDSTGAKFIDLDTVRDDLPVAALAIATPSAVQLTPDEATLLVTASGSDLLVTVDPQSQAVLGRVNVGAVPEGIIVEPGPVPRAWVFNAADNSVSLVDLGDVTQPRLVQTVPLEDPTPAVIKRGRIAFSTARASSTATFSCASCHPDGHTDQLLWVLNTPIVSGGNQIMPRSTMPVRGLRDTAPFHWDGIPGDPYGGINSASVHAAVPPNSRVDVPTSSTRHLVDGGLASTMSLVGDTTVNDEGLAGRLSKAERDDMAEFLLSVPYPPAPRRAYTNVLSAAARDGFRLFHIEGDNDPSKSSPNVCGDCHRLPFLVSTNTPGTGMETPTWRGAYDRWLILPQGRLNIIDFDFYRRVAEQGTPERSVWQFSWAGRRRFDPVWDMVLEGSTGFPGAFARQVTLSRDTGSEPAIHDLLHALVNAARQELGVLEGVGVRMVNGVKAPLKLQWVRERGFVMAGAGPTVPSDWSEADLLAKAAEGEVVVTLVARLGAQAGADQAQPALWTVGPIEKQRGHQEFPALSPETRHMVLSGRHLAPEPFVLVDGERVTARLSVEGERIEIDLAELPGQGLHFLQLQNPGGLTSNEFLFEVYPSEAAARAKGRRLVDILVRTRWEKLLGTWKDEESAGAGLTQVIRWKIPDRVLEITSRERDNESVALVTVDASSGEVLHTGGNARGDLFQGRWDLSQPDDAVLNLQFTGGTGQKGNVVVHHQWLGEGRMEIRLDLPQPIRVKLKRHENVPGQ